MARTLGKLTALAVSRAKDKGLYPDGGGLYLQVGPTGARSWLFRFTLKGRARAMGLGPVHTVGLADARTKAGDCRRLLLAGIDPIESQAAQRSKAGLEAARALTFKACAEAYIAAHKAGWRHPKYAAQWRATVETYCNPLFGSLPVQDVDVGLVMQALEPIWTVKTEMASRLRGRIEVVLDWARTRGHRTGENPARWRGHLENLLPRKSKVHRVRHHPALPYPEIGAFMAALRGRGGRVAPALRFLIFTAARTAEVRGARWSEMNLAEKVWTVPAERIKAGKEHRVPLSQAALGVLRDLGGPPADGDGFVFPGAKKGRPISDMSMLVLLDDMGRPELTAHGFRSSFRDWAAECTNFPREVAEMALAHAVPDKVEAAYRRGDLFAKRRQLMEAWARHCATVKPAGKVVPIGGAAQA